MRQIKFRGKRLHNMDWVYGDYCSQDTDYSAMIGVWNHSQRICEWIPVWEETVGQFTGLTDKNGKEIYEGDKLICYHHQFEENVEAVVFFDNGTFMLYQILSDGTKKAYRYWNDGNHDWYSMEQFDSFELEIIGNIHDNSELLK